MGKKNNKNPKIKKEKIKLTPEEKAEHAAAVKKAVKHFAEKYVSSDGSRLSNLQALCKDLEVNVAPDALTCKQNIKNANVNIHDFIRVSEEDGDISTIKFPSNEALQKDIRSHPKRMFPLRLARSDQLLEAMLIFVTGKGGAVRT